MSIRDNLAAWTVAGVAFVVAMGFAFRDDAREPVPAQAAVGVERPRPVVPLSPLERDLPLDYDHPRDAPYGSEGPLPGS